MMKLQTIVFALAVGLAVAFAASVEPDNSCGVPSDCHGDGVVNKVAFAGYKRGVPSDFYTPPSKEEEDDV